MATCLGQRLGHQAEIVDRQAMQIEAQIPGERHQRVVSDRLGRNVRARRRGTHQRHGHGRGGTVGQADIGGRQSEPTVLQPLDRSHAVARKDHVGPERQRRVRRQGVSEPGQRLLEPGQMQRLADRLQDRQIDDLDRTLGQIGWLRFTSLGLDEAATAGLPGDQPAPDQLLIGAADGLHRQLEVVGQLAMGRQARTRRQAAVVNGASDLVGQRQIRWTLDQRGIGTPECHDILGVRISPIGNRIGASSYGANFAWRAAAPRERMSGSVLSEHLIQS